MRYLIVLGFGIVLGVTTSTSFAQSVYHPLGGGGSNSYTSSRASVFSGGSSSTRSSGGLSRSMSAGSLVSSMARQGLNSASGKVLEGAREEFFEEYPKAQYGICSLKAAGHCGMSVLSGELDRFVAAGQQKSGGYLSSIREEAIQDCKAEVAMCRRSYAQDIMRFCEAAPRAANLYYDCDAIKAEWKCLEEESEVSRFMDLNSSNKTCLERQSEGESLSSLFGVKE